MQMRFPTVVCIALLGASAAANSLVDGSISFSTEGVDRYADGSAVIDGECYALVWSDDGVFEGLSADGACIDAEDRLVLVAPVAKNGRCPLVLFQISADLADELSKGVYAVYLLDTRIISNGTVSPAGLHDGVLELVNGYGAVTDGVKVSGSGVNAVSGEAGSGVSVASVVARPPSDCEQPRVRDIRIEGDYVYLTVDNLDGYMRVHGGDDIKASDSTGAAVATDGETGETVLVAPKRGGSGFFRVVRSPSIP